MQTAAKLTPFLLGREGEGPTHHCFFYIASNEKLGGTHESLEVKYTNQLFVNWTVLLMNILSLHSFIKPHIDSVKVSACTHCTRNYNTAQRLYTHNYNTVVSSCPVLWRGDCWAQSTVSQCHAAATWGGQWEVHLGTTASPFSLHHAVS